MKYKVGDIIDFNGIKGRIESAAINNKIGFNEEKNREPIYTIVFNNVPESKICIEDGSISKTDIKESPQKKRKSPGRKGKLHSITNKSAPR